jgi:hypothetical protein
MRRAGQSAYLVIAWLFLAAVITQFFLAGLGIFGAKTFEPHKVRRRLHGLALAAPARDLCGATAPTSSPAPVRDRDGAVLAPEARDDAPGVAALRRERALHLDGRYTAVARSSRVSGATRSRPRPHGRSATNGLNNL